MKVAVVYQYYQGHDSPGHSLMYELTQFLARRGHEVTVIAGETGYMRQSNPGRPWYRRLIRKERDGRVDVIRTYTYAGIHRSYFARLLSFLSFTVSGPFGLLRAARPDVVLASSPPIFPMLSIWLVCKLRRVPLVLEVRDLWPESAVQLGILRNRALIGIMRWMERTLYNQAHSIVALTGGIRDDILRRGWTQEKLALIPCGIDFEMLHPDAALAREVRAEHSWEGRKIVLYFGAMGEANNLSVILRAAERLRQSDCLFVLIGDGMKRHDLMQQAEAMNLNNVLILPSISKQHARGYISAADICLVTLRDIPLFGGAIPTKLLDYMACARPVLCGIGGEAAEITEAAGSGYRFSPDDDAELARLIETVIDDPALLQSLGNSGLAHVREHYGAGQAHLKMEAVLGEAAGYPIRQPLP